MTRKPDQEKALDDLAAQSRKGAVALFAGPSGTGKIRAAQALANSLGAPLQTANLATLVSKYIGETEKNLDRAIKEASQSGAVLLFDEADALFGKRSEVSDSHDRYANQEVSYLFQCLEQSGGIVILTTNSRDNIDSGFIRRCHSVLCF